MINVDSVSYSLYKLHPHVAPCRGSNSPHFLFACSEAGSSQQACSWPPLFPLTHSSETWGHRPVSQEQYTVYFCQQFTVRLHWLLRIFTMYLSINLSELCVAFVCPLYVIENRYYAYSCFHRTKTYTKNHHCCY